MENELTLAALATIPGIATFVALVVEFLVKPRLRRRFGMDREPDPTVDVDLKTIMEIAAVEGDYRVAMNTWAAGIGVAAALVGSLAATFPPSFESIAQAILVGLVGAAAGIGGAETVSNFRNR